MHRAPTWPRLALALAGLLGGGGVAAQTATDAPQPQGWYAVEVIVFDQRATESNELWPLEPTLPTAPPRLGGLAPPAVGERIAYRRLGPSELALGGIRQRLENANGYEVLYHFGWLQPGVGQSDSAFLPLPLDWKPPTRTASSPTASADATHNPFGAVPEGTRLFGAMQVYRGRYLHFVTDLRYVPDGYSSALFRTRPAAEAEPPVTDPVLGNSDGLAPVAALQPLFPAPAVMPLVQSRRMRRDEIHYVDHPRIGIIVQARRLEETPGDNASQQGNEGAE